MRGLARTAVRRVVSPVRRRSFKVSMMMMAQFSFFE
jgi:acetolactate synthase regulatory subunit